MDISTLADIAWGFYDFVAAIFIIVDVMIAVGFIYALRRSWHFRPSSGGHAGHSEGHHKETMHDIVMKERWHAIEAKFALGTPEAARISIIEADALVDAALKSMQIEGEHLADRLSNLESDDIKSMPRIWRAHRMRNDLVHTPGFAVSPQDAERTMQDYRTFLKEIEVID